MICRKVPEVGARLAGGACAAAALCSAREITRHVASLMVIGSSDLVTGRMVTRTCGRCARAARRHRGYNPGTLAGVEMRHEHLRLFAAITLSLQLSSTIDAHHSFAAQYDASKPIEMRGTVTKVEWTNPHARIYIDVRDDKGQIANWNFEMASPSILVR